MRILSWNIMQGGGKRLQAILQTIQAHNADVLVLGEYHYGAVGRELQKVLKHLGYTHQALPEQGSAGERKGVLVASRRPLEFELFGGQIVCPKLGDHSHRCVLARIDGINLFGAYFANSERKKPLFDFFLNLPADALSGASVIIGDFNTGLAFEDECGDTFACAAEFRALLGQGWIDAWRSRNPAAREFTWYSRQANNGFRLDHALVSPLLNQRITNIRYSHAERESKVSDHSALLVEIE